MSHHLWSCVTSFLSWTVQRPQHAERKSYITVLTIKKNTDGRTIKNYRTAMTFVLRAHAGLSLQTPHTLCILNYRICDALLLLTAGLHVPGRRLGLQLGLIKTERQFIVLSMALPVGVQTEYGVNSRKPDFRAWKSCYVSGFQADRRFVTEG